MSDPGANRTALDAMEGKILAGLDPTEHGLALRNLAKVLSWAGKSEDAARAARQALKALGDDEDSFFVLAEYASSRSDSEAAIAFLREALRLDPDFAQAWALLAVVHGDFYWFRTDVSSERLDRMKQALDKAFALNPGMPEARMALAAYYYRGFYDYPRALEQLLLAQEMIPNDPLVHYNLALTYRRLGDYDQSIASFLQATQMDPAFEEAWYEALNTAHSANRKTEATEITNAVQMRFENSPRMAGEQVMIRLKLFGDLDGARRILLAGGDGDHYYFHEASYYLAQWSRDFQSASEIAQRPMFMEGVSKGFGVAEAAMNLELGGQTELAGQLRLEADELLEVEITKPYAENFAWPHVAYARNLSQLGRHEEAMASCDRATRILPVQKDKVHGASIAATCAWVQAHAGDTEGALDQLEILMEIGWDMNHWFQTLSPEWDFLRGNPRFDALAAMPLSEN